MVLHDRQASVGSLSHGKSTRTRLLVAGECHDTPPGAPGAPGAPGDLLSAPRPLSFLETKCTHSNLVTYMTIKKT